jgi:hypothetical protein
MKRKEQKTNVETVTELMEFSNFGPLAQVFVIDALCKMSEAVAESKVEDYPDTGFIHPEAWIGVAKEIREKLKKYDL